MSEERITRAVLPLGDKALVRMDEAPNKIGRILIPDASKEKPCSGELLAVGDGCEDSLRKLIGCRVHFHSYSGNEVPGRKNIVYIRGDDLLGYEPK